MTPFLALQRLAPGFLPMVLASVAGILAGLVGFLGGPVEEAGASLRPVSALLVLMLAGGVILALNGEARPGLRRGGLVLGGLAGVACLGSLTLALTGVGPGWPRFFRALQQLSIPAALALSAASLSLLLRWGRRVPSWAARQTAAILALIPLGAGFLGVQGFLSGIPLLYGAQRMPMSLPAGLGALLLGLSLVLASGSDTWPLALFRLRHPEHESTVAQWFAHGPLGLFLLVGIGILGGGSLYLRGQIHSARQGAERELAAVGDLKARQIAQWYEERRGDGEQILRTGLIQTQLTRFLAGGPQAPPAAQILGWMRSLQNGTYRRIVLLDAEGRTRLSVPPEGSATGFEPGAVDSARLKEALHARGVLIQDLHRDSKEGAIHLSVWVPIGTARGVLLLMVDPGQFLYPLVQEWPGPSPSAETQLVRREGESVAFLNDMRHRAGTALALRLSLRAHADMAGARAAEGGEGIFEGLDYRGIPVLAALRQVPGTPWALVSKVDEAEIYGPARRKVWMVEGALLGLMILVALAMGLIVRQHDANQIEARMRLEREKRLLSDRYAHLMGQASDIILVMDPGGRILEANPRAESALGYSAAQLCARHIWDIHAPEDRDTEPARFQQVLTGDATRFEGLFQRADGTTFPVEVSATRVDLAGQAAVLGFVRDITERKAQERELQRMTRLYAALSQVNQAIVWSPDRQALLDKICEVMVGFGGFRMAWIGWDDPVTHRIFVAARHGDAKGMLDRVVVRSDDSPEGHGAVGTAIRQGSPCLINDFLGSPESAPWRDELAASGFASIAAFPVRQAGEVRGALVVYAPEKDFFGLHEAALLEEAAMDISYALDHLAGEARREAAEAALKESERFLQGAQEAGGVGTYIWRIQEDTWQGSPFLDRIFGVDEAYPRDLKGWADLVAPEARAGMEAYVAGILERRESFDYEYPILRPSDGARRWLHGRGEFQWDERGRPLALMGVIQDITERRQAEQALRASEEKFYKAFQASPDSVNINRLSDGIYLAINEGFTQITGYTEEDALGRSSLPGDLGIWVREEDRARLQDGLRSTGRVVGLEAPFRRKDGTMLTGLMSASIIEIDGEPAVLSITRDISELRRQAQQLERMTQMYAALSQVNQAIVWSPDRQALLDKICEVMVVFGKFSMAWIGWNDPATSLVEVVASHGDAHGYLDGLQVRSDDVPMGQGPTGMAIREGCACIVNDFFGASEAKPWHAAAARCGFASSAAFPIREGGEVRGALMVYSTEKDFFGPHEAALLEEAAGDVSFALDHLAGERRRLEAEAAQARLLHILESSLNEIYVFDVETLRFVYVNQGAQRNLGYPWENLQRMTAVDLKPEFTEATFRKAIEPLMRHELAQITFETLHQRSDGSRYPVEVHLQLVEREGERYFLAVIMDITERRRADEAIHKVSVAVEQSPLCVVITDLQGRIEYVNPRFTEVTGYTYEEALGQNPRILKSPATPPEVHRQMWETLAKGEVWVGEFENLKKGGESFQERATIAPVKDAAGTITHYVAIKEDITAQREAEAERRSLEAQLHQSQKLESLGSLAGGVAHDMNNVLGAILSLASTLREKADPLGPEFRSLETIQTACLRGRGVVKSLLYFARKDLQEEACIDVNALVKEMTQLLSYTTLKRIRLEMDLQEPLGRLRGDAGALSHALMNLCVNSMDAMPGSGILRIQTTAAPDGGIVIRVADTGQGMSPEVLQRAMEPFFTTKPQGKGTGLGLSMVYGTMQAHEGRFELRSEPGKGTEAILSFPAARVEPLEICKEAELQAAPASVEGLRILLVDDDELIRESVTSVLEILGHLVLVAPGGQAALDLLAAGNPADLVILDMNMPGMNGAEALPRLQSLRPGLPVLMATGYSDEDIAPLIAGHPNVASIQKPFSMKELKRKLDEFGVRPGEARQG